MICFCKARKIMFSIKSIMVKLYMKLESVLICIVKMEIPNVPSLMKSKNGLKESIFILHTLKIKLISTIIRIVLLNKYKNWCQVSLSPIILQMEDTEWGRTFSKKMTIGWASYHPLKKKYFTTWLYSTPTLLWQNLIKDNNWLLKYTFESMKIRFTTLDGCSSWLILYQISVVSVGACSQWLQWWLVDLFHTIHVLRPCSICMATMMNCMTS